MNTPSILHALPRPRIDRTCAGVDGFLIDGSCGRAGSYGNGRRYSVRRTHAGYEVGYPLTQDVEQARALLAYLGGPRETVLCVTRLGAVSYDDQRIDERRLAILDGPHVDDWRGWQNWLALNVDACIRSYHKSGERLHLTLVDTEAANLSGVAGFHCLASITLLRGADERWTRC